MAPRSRLWRLPSTRRRTNANQFAFARHWYSTYVDILTRENEGKRVLEFPESALLGVTKIPVFQALREQKQPCPHHSAWGEWYLACQGNSENTELGIDLINNLLTARKITDLVFSGAGLPCVSQAYQLFGDAICPYTDKTFNEIREEFFKDAKSRTAFFNYRKVGRILWGALKVILSNENADVGGFREGDQ